MLPNFLQPCFPSYDLKTLDVKKDKKLIITEILNKGDEKAVRWLGKRYSVNEIRKTVANPIKGMWLSSILNHWLKIFDLKLNREIYQKAIINLNQF